MVLAAFMVPHPPMIVPDVGRGSEAQISETAAAYKRVAEEVARLKPDAIVISSPHATMYADYFCISSGRGAKGSFADFNASGVRFDEAYDEELIDEIEVLSQAQGLTAGTLGQVQKALDHGTMVPLWFIRNAYSEGKIVRIGLSGLPLADHYALGKVVKEAAERTGRRIVFIGSGDLSHKLQTYGPYGFAEEGPEYDKKIMDLMGRASFGELFDFPEDFCEKAAECGHRSFTIMAGALDGEAVKAESLSYQDVTGVGYGICSFYPEGEDKNRHFLAKYLNVEKEKLADINAQADAYVQLAKESLEAYIKEGRTISVPADVPAEMLNEKAGAFVSIHKHGKLRGCIGTFLPTQKNLAEEIIQNAISASTRDPRFDAITEDELAWLEINVDVLSAPEDISSKDELDVKRYGVIVSSKGRRGLLLPDLDGVDTVEQQVDIARQKAGIGKGEELSLQRFEVVRHR